MDNRSSIILLEDKELVGLNKVHKNVLKAAPTIYTNKSKIYYDPSKKNEYDEMVIDAKILDFASDGIQFDQQVVKSKAIYALPYTPTYVHEIFKNKKDLGNDFIIRPEKYKINEVKTLNKLFMDQWMKEKKEKKEEKDLVKVDEIDNLDTNMLIQLKSSDVKFKPREGMFLDPKLSSSETNILAIEPNSVLDLKKQNSKLSKSLNNIQDGESSETVFFLTEVEGQNENKSAKPVLSKKDLKAKEEKESRGLKRLEEVDWDENLIDLLSEGTARWIAMKRVTDLKQKQKLIQLVEKKHGRYTRDIKDLELVEDNLTEFELRKIAEEKLRLKLENEKFDKLPVIETEVETATKDIPLYRLPHGLKQELLEKINALDPNANSTAKIDFKPSRIYSPKTYQEKMKAKNVTEKTLFMSEHPYHIEMIAGNNTHVITERENTIKLENGKQFVKKVQKVFPAEFTEWVSGIVLAPVDKPELKKPIKGRKKWKDLPEMIDDKNIQKPNGVELNNFWHLLPITPDTQLRKILKSNQTVARVVEEWRRRWQAGNRWNLAEIEDLITDMHHDHANIRFQAVVVCSRAAEQIQLMLLKLETYNKRKNSLINETLADADENEKRELLRSAISMASAKTNPLFNDSFFPEKLFESIENLIKDTNDKVKLAACIAIFSIMRKFIRPYTQKYQSSKDKAEDILRQTLDHYNNSDRYAAAQCLALDGICEKKIIKILLNNYFNSNEQVTKEQVTKSLSDLSANNNLVMTMLEKFLKSEQAREKILACKMFPCLRKSPNKEITSKLINIMWNDRNRHVKKVAAQTLGRTGKGQEVHDEICNRIQSSNSFDRYEALNKINHIGIMTNKLLELYLKCFKDDYINVRELACKVAQNLYEKNSKVISALIFTSRFDKVTKIKALAIRTLGLIGDFSDEIRKCLIWAVQFERDPLVRTESCHSIILLIKNKKDQELVDILHERHLVEEEPIVRKEIMDALNYLGYDPNKELPIVTKIKSDVKKLNDKNLIISKIKEIETNLNFEYEKQRLIWIEKEDSDKKSEKKDQPQKPPEIFEPTKFKLNIDMNANKDEYMEKISQFLEEVNTISKNKTPKKVKSSTTNFLSKLVLEKSDFLTSSAKSMNSISDIPSLEDFSSINKLDTKRHQQPESGDYIDDENEEINSIYYDEYIGQPHQKAPQNPSKQINSEHLRSVQRSNATNNTHSSLKIDTIIEES